MSYVEIKITRTRGKTKTYFKDEYGNWIDAKDLTSMFSDDFYVSYSLPVVPVQALDKLVEKWPESIPTDELIKLITTEDID